MFEELNRQLEEIQAKLQERYKIRRRLEGAQKSFKEVQNRLEELKGELYKEEDDVKKLEGLSISNLFYSILGTKDERMKKERQEHLAAKLKYDECMDEFNDLEKEINDLKMEMGEFSVLEREYQDILRKKEEMLEKTQNSYSREVLNLSEELGRARASKKEIQEAINAGRTVIAALEKVLGHLDSARNWGTWDMMGGGMISTAMKHSRIDNARDAAHQVQHLLRRFERELKDVGRNRHLNIEIGSFATFADYFFDGLIADWTVQSRINKSRESTAQILRRVECVVQDLRNTLKEAEKEINRIEYEKKDLVEKA